MHAHIISMHASHACMHLPPKPPPQKHRITPAYIQTYVQRQTHVHIYAYGISARYELAMQLLQRLPVALEDRVGQTALLTQCLDVFLFHAGVVPFADNVLGCAFGAPGSPPPAPAGVALVLAGLDELQLGERGLTGRFIPGVVCQSCPQTAWGELAQVRQVLHHARPVVGKFAYACIHSAKARSKQVRKLSGIRPAVRYFCGGRLRSRALGTLDSMCAAGRPSRTWSAGRVGCRGSRSCGRKAASWAF